MANIWRFRNPSLRSRSAPIARQLTAFVGVGLAATSLHYVILVSFVQLEHVNPVPATLLGFTVGGLLSYFLNRRHTFDSERPHREAVWRFTLVVGVAFLLTFAFMSVMVNRWHVPYLLAQLVTTCVVMLWSFSAHRHWTFRVLPGTPEGPP